MTNYNERLDEVLSKTPCPQCDGSGAYPDYDGEPVQCQFCWQLRFTFIDKAKQAINSLNRELVAEAKPVANSKNANKDTCFLHDNYTYSCVGCQRQAARVYALAEFEQNLLKKLEEV